MSRHALWPARHWMHHKLLSRIPKKTGVHSSTPDDIPDIRTRSVKLRPPFIPSSRIPLRSMRATPMHPVARMQARSAGIQGIILCCPRISLRCMRATRLFSDSSMPRIRFLHPGYNPGIIRATKLYSAQHASDAARRACRCCSHPEFRDKRHRHSSFSAERRPAHTYSATPWHP